MPNAVDHEHLDCSRLAVGVATWLRAARFPRYSTELRKQATKAADSLDLNFVEGASRTGDAAKNHVRIAFPSISTCAPSCCGQPMVCF